MEDKETTTMSKELIDPIAIGTWVIFDHQDYTVYAINTRQHIENPDVIQYSYDIYNPSTHNYIVGISKNNFEVKESKDEI